MMEARDQPPLVPAEAETGEAQKRRLLLTLRVRALLTPEQRAKFMELRKTARPPRPGGPRRADKPQADKP